MVNELLAERRQAASADVSRVRQLLKAA